ncbi:GAF domain-containing protein [Roseateles sp. UC29_93]|uniref:GAF domain-containing protein n=1 Tax=Roseateles sp. UC29_93 TaxID=3350177 RepID=UPI00366E06D1
MNGSILLILLLTVCVAALLWRLHLERTVHARARTRDERVVGVLTSVLRANRMVQRIDDERELLREACQICVDAGYAILAAVYQRDGDLARRAASAGPAAEVLANVPDPLDLRDAEIQRSYTARVLRDGVSAVSNNYVLDAQAGRWRAEAVAQGIRAIAWIPVRRAGEVECVLMLCAREADFFDAELMTMLEELGADLSFAMDIVDARRARELNFREIEAGRERFRRLFQAAPIPMAIVALKDRRIVEADQALCQRYGKSEGEILGTSTASHAYGVLPEDRDLFYRVLATNGRVRDLRLRLQGANGEVTPVILCAEPIEHLGESCCLITSLELQPMNLDEPQ